MKKTKYTYSCYVLNGATKWYLTDTKRKELLASGTVTDKNYAEQVPVMLDQLVKILNNEVSESD